MKPKKPQESLVSYCILESPVGNILIAGDHMGLKFINFQDGPNSQVPDPIWKEKFTCLPSGYSTITCIL